MKNLLLFLSPENICPVLLSFLFFLGHASAQEEQELSPQDKFKARMEKVQEESKKAMGYQVMLSQMIGLTNNSELMKEMEIVGEQREQLQAIAKSYMEEMQDTHRKQIERQKELQIYLKNGEHEKVQELAIEMQSANADAVNAKVQELEEILLPHQMERMRQLSLQNSVKFRTDYSGFLGLPLAVADQLGLSIAETNRLKDATEKADTELRAEVKRLNAEKMKQILDALPADKQKRFQEIVGDLYDVNERRRLSRIEEKKRRQEEIDKHKEKLEAMRNNGN